MDIQVPLTKGLLADKYAKYAQLPTSWTANQLSRFQLKLTVSRKKPNLWHSPFGLGCRTSQWLSMDPLDCCQYRTNRHRNSGRQQSNVEGANGSGQKQHGRRHDW